MTLTARYVVTAGMLLALWQLPGLTVPRAWGATCRLQEPFGEIKEASWEGDCVNGLASGLGIATWSQDGKPFFTRSYTGSNGLRASNGRSVVARPELDSQIHLKVEDCATEGHQPVGRIDVEPSVAIGSMTVMAYLYAEKMGPFLHAECKREFPNWDMKVYRDGTLEAERTTIGPLEKNFDHVATRELRDANQKFALAPSPAPAPASAPAPAAASTPAATPAPAPPPLPAPAAAENKDAAKTDVQPAAKSTLGFQTVEPHDSPDLGQILASSGSIPQSNIHLDKVLFEFHPDLTAITVNVTLTTADLVTLSNKKIEQALLDGLLADSVGLRFPAIARHQLPDAGRSPDNVTVSVINNGACCVLRATMSQRRPWEIAREAKPAAENAKPQQDSHVTLADALAMEKRARRTRFMTAYVLNDVVTAEQVRADPAAYVGRRVGVWVRFLKMSGTSAVFTGGDAGSTAPVMIASNVPPTLFSQPSLAVLAVEITGNQGGLIQARYLGAYRCSNDACDEFSREKS